jgi:quercetin dioxygenase-like cupin family protein
MPHVTFDSDGNAMPSSYSMGTGSGLRSERIELSQLVFEKGKGADVHSHPEEQVMYVLSGRLRVVCGDETYDVGPGEATFNPANVAHGVMAVEDTVCLSFKDQIAPVPEAPAGVSG